MPDNVTEQLLEFEMGLLCYSQGLRVAICLLVSSWVSLGTCQPTARCSVQNGWSIGDFFVTWTIENIESKIQCMATCLEHPKCKGVHFQGQVKTCRHYDEDVILVWSPVFKDSNDSLIHCVEGIRASIIAVEQGFTLSEAEAVCDYHRGRLITPLELRRVWDAIIIETSTCSCGWLSDGSWKFIQQSPKPECSCLRKGAYCTFADLP